MKNIFLNFGELILKEKDLKNLNNIEIFETHLNIKLKYNFQEYMIKLYKDKKEILIDNQLYFKYHFDNLEFDIHELDNIDYNMLGDIKELLKIAYVGYISLNDLKEDFTIFKFLNEYCFYTKIKPEITKNEFNYNEFKFLSIEEKNELKNYYHKFKQNDFKIIFEKIFKQLNLNTDLIKFTTDFKE